MTPRPKQKQYGDPMVSFRCKKVILKEMRDYVASTMHTRKSEPLTQNAFIVAAIVEKLAHIRRSKATRKKKTAAEQAADKALSVFL